MKVLRNTEWEPFGWVSNYPGIEGPAYLFKHKQHGEIIACNKVKWIDVCHNRVYFYIAETRKVSVSGRQTGAVETSLPEFEIIDVKRKKVSVR